MEARELQGPASQALLRRREAEVIDIMESVCRELDWVESDPQRPVMIINALWASGYIDEQNEQRTLRMVIQAYYRMRARLSTKVSDDVLMSSVLSTYREDHGIHPESLYVRLLERWEDR